MALHQSDLQTSSKRLIRGISFQHKLAILRQLEAGVPRKDICENLQCCQSTISRILVTKQSILEMAERERHLSRKPGGGMVTYKDIDEALSKWAQEMKRNNQMITSGLAKQKAEEIARALGEEDFMPSAGWLYKWKERENVQFCKKSKLIEGAHGTPESVGNEEILKGLLEKNGNVEENPKDLEDMRPKQGERINQISNEEKERENNTNLRGIQETIRLENNELQKNQNHFLDDSRERNFYKNAVKNISSANNTDPLLSPTKTSIPSANPSSNSTPIMAGSSQQTTLRNPSKKVSYSYDPVYVLTSTGRYRKVKTFLTLLQKLEILQRLKNGEKRMDLIHEYRLSQSAMCQIIADEKKIKRMAAIGQNLQMKRIRGGIFKAGESELNKWVLQKMDEGETLTRNQVKNKAREIANQMKIEFKASTGWLEKWKARMNMDFNERQILYRKKQLYAKRPESMDVQIGDHNNDREDDHQDPEDNDILPQHHRNSESISDTTQNYPLDFSGDSSLDIKPFEENHEQFYPEVVTVLDDEEDEEDVKPFQKSPPIVLPDEDESSSNSSSQDEHQTLHQQVIAWFNKYNIAPTAATELLTILHPVISENPDAPHQTRLTITTKPASRSKGRPYAQHTYS